ncbi:hypothetical protein [Roseibium aggregatum]|uniref:Uncharacterized protein n=1 Tax=Roseibium aggregatum TaxID=187304 RepID=A0A926S400_9HYPH|nr:hypothetical protein [Roseibium aggregatum]MBD1544881.1 hypothetical protein [Roseibium aggregatum]
MDDTKIDTSMVLPPNLIPSNHDSGWTNPFRPAGYSVKPGGGQTYTVSVSPDPNAGWTTSTTQVRVEYVKDGAQVSELHTIQPDGRKISFTVTTDDVQIMGSPKVYFRNLTPIPTAVRIEVSRDLVFRRHTGTDLPSDEAETTHEVPRKRIDRGPKGSLGDKPVLRGRVQREDVSRPAHSARTGRHSPFHIARADRGRRYSDLNSRLSGRAKHLAEFLTPGTSMEMLNVHLDHIAEGDFEGAERLMEQMEVWIFNDLGRTQIHSVLVAD